MIAATQDELERVRAERDALQKQLNAALEREAALAAHVERQNDLLRMLVDVPELTGGKWESMSRNAVMEKPTTSLARRELIKQAEALEGAADEFEVHERARQCLKWKAEKLRQRAQELAP